MNRMQFLKHDSEVLLLCEDLQRLMHNFEEKMSLAEEADQPLKKRLDAIKTAIDSERRLIEDISLPGRYGVNHFSMILNEISNSMGFEYREVKSGRGRLNQIDIGEWGQITVKIGDVELSWRDHDVQYMFYPDQIVVRPKDSAEDEMRFFFSYSLKYAQAQLEAYQAVKNDPQTAYWHENLNI